MKKILVALTFMLATTTFTFAQMKMDDTTHMHMMKMHKKYTCTMYPEVVRSKTGKCPKCGMKLVAMKGKSKNMSKPKGEMKM